MTGLRRPLLRFSVVLAVAGLIPHGVEAQTQRVINIGALTEAWGPTPAVVGLRDGLLALGYRENEQFAIGVRFTQGDLTALPEAARGLVRSGASIIFVQGEHAAKAAQEATDRLPVVFVGVSDPVELRLVQSFPRPGGNITGVADRTVELAPKRLELFHGLVPGLKRVLLPYNAGDAYSVSLLGMYRDAARRLGITLVERPLRTEHEAGTALASVRKREVDGILSPKFLSLNIPGFILETTSKQLLPAMFHETFWVEQGGLASYAANLYEVGRQAARLVDKIVKGAMPGDLPVEQPTKFEFVINLKTARALGLTIPPSVLLRADQIIE